MGSVCNGDGNVEMDIGVMVVVMELAILVVELVSLVVGLLCFWWWK